MTRHPRRRANRGRSRVGERFTAVVGPVAHGGHCVIRLPVSSDGQASRVVFTRHALPGETVVVEITEGSEGDRFWRGDAVEILDPSPDRVAPPCPVAGPGLCGGCDFQHATLARQRALKADVVREQLVRLGRLDPDDPLVAGLVVEAVTNPLVEPGRDDGLRWRTRVRFATAADGRRGMRKHRSHHVVAVDDCLIARPDALGSTGSTGEGARASVVELVETTSGSHEFPVEADGFWQVHPGAPRVLVETVLDLLAPTPGESVLDLYAGVGLFTRFLADAVGAGARVVAVEGDRRACAHARRTLGESARVSCGRVDHVLASSYDEPFDLVVLDPPREGAGRAVVEEVVGRVPRAVAYVACDPAALARDLATFAGHGYRLRALRAFDLFPMTHHVECAALLSR